MSRFSVTASGPVIDGSTQGFDIPAAFIYRLIRLRNRRVGLAKRRLTQRTRLISI